MVCSMAHKIAIGVDFGTLSGRALLVDLETGAELASASLDYPHAVMDKTLPDGKTKLEQDFALQHPMDYMEVFRVTIPKVLKTAGVEPGQVVGIGIDFTACTLLPTLADGTPLCTLPEFEHNPHAYVKLWKHHAAQDKANRLNEIAAARKEPWLARYGGKISSEWMVPKIWETLDKAESVYNKADRFIEAADWVVWQLVGKETRNSCTAGYKGLWHKKNGYPSKEFYAALDPRMADLTSTKLDCPVSPLGTKAGGLSAFGAEITGLLPGTAVAVGNVDAHVAIPATKIDSAGKMLIIMGTSSCHMLVSKEERAVPGICGVVEDGILPGMFGYEAGQSCVGDHFAWFVDHLLPADIKDEAAKRGVSPHVILEEQASRLKPGQSGLLALDWWNGNRSTLVDVDLTGMILGMTLQTTASEIYRTLIEATAFGTRIIIENFVEHGVAVDELVAAGGIAEKNTMMMQIYADVTNLPIHISGSPQAPGLGSAIFGAVAAGKAAGGFDSLSEASSKLGKLKDTAYLPHPENVKVYDKLYAEYKTLYNYFGRENDVMKRLKSLRETQNQ